ncbi:MAG: FG-GAP-like repeat-containing protein [Thermoplasmatota archaeon]
MLAVLVMVFSGLVGLAALVPEQTEAVEEGSSFLESRPTTLDPDQRQGDHDLDDKPPEYYLKGERYYYFGTSMKKCDINGDGIEDLAVLAQGFQAHSVFIFDGATDVMFPKLQMDADSARWKIGSFGYYLDDIEIGDVNGDGYDDILIGRPYYSYGYAYLYYGGPDWDSKSTVSSNSWDARFYSSSSYYYFGQSVGLGDLDGDGYDDVFVSAPGRDYVYWWYGSSSMSGTYQYYSYDGRIYGQDAFGQGGIELGDFNGDGRDDLAIGQPYQYEHGSYSGSLVFISPKSNIRDFLSGSCTGSNSYWDYIEYTGWTSYSLIGSNIQLFDYNGDGYDDLIFGGNAYYTKRASDARYVWLIEGKSTFPTGTDNRISDSSNYDYRFYSGNWGIGSNAWGDYDNDGKYDLLLGEYNSAAYVVMNEEFNGTSSKDIDVSEKAVLTIYPHRSSYWAYPGYYYYSYSYPIYNTVMFWDRDDDGRDEMFVADPRINIGGDYYCGAIYGVTPYDMFGIGDFESEGGDLPDGKTFYSRYKPYTFSMSAWNKWDPTMTDMSARLLFNDYAVEFAYDGDNGFRKTSDPLDFVELLPDHDVKIVGDDIIVTFSLIFEFDIDECNIDVAFTANAAHMSYTEILKDVGKVRNKLLYVGSLEVYWEEHGTAEVGDLLRTGCWLPEDSVLRFTGVKLVYNGTEDFMDDLGVEPYYPHDEEFHIETYSSLRDVVIDNSSSGRNFTTILPAGDRPLTVTYSTYQVGVPSNKIINSIPDFEVHVDVDVPTVPPGIRIHADDYYDENTRVDNDGELYVTWGKPGEYNSGIKHYEVRVNGDDDTIFETKATFAKVNTQASGEVTVEVRAVDRVGHVGEWGSASIDIDREGLDFTDPIPSETEWFNILDPEVGVTIADIGGNAVVGSSVEYAVSYDGGETFGEWTSAGVVLNAPVLQVMVNPMLMEGTMSMVKFRAMDEAGNVAESEPHGVNVDISGVSFGDLEISGYDEWEYEWLDHGEVELNLDVFDEYSGVSQDSIQFRLSTLGRKNLDLKPWLSVGADSVDVIDENTVRIDLSLVGEQELSMGDRNYVQFRARDVLDNAMTYSDIYNIWVNTEPVPEISSPEDRATYSERDIIVFDASGSMDHDGDALTYTWTDTYETGDGVVTEELGDMGLEDLERFEMSLVPGEHSIVLHVSDGIHEVSTDPINITVEDYIEPVWLYDIDSDGDGMPNWWEYNYKLGWDDSSNGDGTYSSVFEGMSKEEIWEAIGEQYRSGEVSVTPSNDFDSDGHTDYEEYLMGTDPSDEDDFPIFVEQGKPREDSLDLFLMGLIIVSVILLVLVLLFLALNNVLIKKRVDDQRAKEAETDRQLTEQALSSGGLERLEALRSASEGKPVALPTPPPMGTALPSAPAEGEAQPMGGAQQQGEAQPMGQPQPMGGAQQQGEAQPMGQPQPMGGAQQPGEAQPMPAPAPASEPGQAPQPVQGQENADQQQ